MMIFSIKKYVMMVLVVFVYGCVPYTGAQETKTHVYNSYDTSDSLHETLEYGIFNSWISGNKNGFYHKIYKLSGAGEDGYAGYIKNNTGNGSWSFHCGIDSINDKNNCYIRNSGEEYDKYVVYYLRGNSSQFCIGYHDFPHKSSVIRIDDLKPIKVPSKNDGCINVASSLRKKLAEAHYVTVRGYKWPYNYYQDQKISVQGFTEAIEIAQWVDNNMATLDGLLK